jgi:hypothetical protein
VWCSEVLYVEQCCVVAHQELREEGGPTTTRVEGRVMRSIVGGVV